MVDWVGDGFGLEGGGASSLRARDFTKGARSDLVCEPLGEAKKGLEIKTFDISRGGGCNLV